MRPISFLEFLTGGALFVAIVVLAANAPTPDFVASPLTPYALTLYLLYWGAGTLVLNRIEFHEQWARRGTPPRPAQTLFTTLWAAVGLALLLLLPALVAAMFPSPYREIAAILLPGIVFPLLNDEYRKARSLSRRARGLCPTCAYDLRASPTQCPECGTTVPTK